MNNQSDKIVCYRVDDIQNLKQKMLTWINRFSIFCFLDNHQYQSKSSDAECIAGAGAKAFFDSSKNGGLTAFDQFARKQKGNWLFGHFGYDLKNELENLQSQHEDAIGFPDIFFFQPKIFLRLTSDHLEIIAPDPDQVYKEIAEAETGKQPITQKIIIEQKVAKADYLDSVSKLKEHLLKGDCYEINYCMEFFARNAGIDPLQLYRHLSDLSPNPFAGYYRLHDKYLLCASPERFIKKMGNRIISQPIKGTASRTFDNAYQDEQSRYALQHSEKEKAENVMVVDLVRNDLSKICTQGSVKVTELFGVYTFPQVYQMISTIEGSLIPGTSLAEIIKATFPMGSMTGAPKRRVMQLIEQYEKTKRGIYSGALGYIAPSGDFDLNVVIRSIMMNTTSKYLSYQVGSAITYHCDPVQEWHECLHKVAAIKKVLSA